MKILMVTNRLNVGGIEKNMVLLCEELTRRGHQVLAASAPGVLVESFEQAGGTHSALGGAGTGPAGLWRDVRAVGRLLEIEAPDVVHVFSAWAAAVVFLARRTRSWRWLRSRQRRPKVLASLMGIVSRPGEPVAKMWLRAWLTGLGADALIAPSPAMLDLVRRLPLRPRTVLTQSVVGVRMDAAPKDQAGGVREEIGLEESDRLVVTIGRLDPTKSHHLFVEAADLICRARADVHFAIVGDGDLRKPLEAQIRSAGVESRVHLLGEREDVPGVLAHSDVCVRPGIVEGFVGITVLEAQAQRIPVVSFDTMDVRVAIEDGRTGILVRPGDVPALADAISALLDDRGRAGEIGEAGRVEVEKAFSLEQVVTRLEEVYRSLGG